MTRSVKFWSIAVNRYSYIYFYCRVISLTILLLILTKSLTHLIQITDYISITNRYQNLVTVHHTNYKIAEITTMNPPLEKSYDTGQFDEAHTTQFFDSLRKAFSDPKNPFKKHGCFRSIFEQLPNHLKNDVIVTPEGVVMLRGQSMLESQSTKPEVSVVLPDRKPTFDVQDYMKFYETVAKLSDYDLMVSWIVQYLNQYFCIINGNSYEVVECEYAEYEPELLSCSPVMESEMEKIQYPLRYIVRTPAEVKLRFRKCVLYGEDGKERNLYDVWSKSIEAREYVRRVFDPTGNSDDPSMLNTYAGLKANLEIVSNLSNTSMTDVTEESSSIELILEHVLHLVGGNKFYYNYLLDWLAYPIQTGQKTNVAVISKGGQGCGKTLFFTDFIGQKIYGEELFAKIAGGSQIGGDFNAHITGKMYLAIEEPNKFNKGRLNLLKDMITSHTAEVKAKHKNQFFTQDYTNFVFTCNFIPEDMLEGDDRRYFIIQDSGEKVGDHDFFEFLADSMERFYQDFYKFLKMRDIKYFVYGQPPPQTGIKHRLLGQSVDPIFKYLRHLADNETLNDYYKRPSDGIPVLPWKAFFNNAVSWCEQECEEISWKRSPLALKNLLKDKLGTGGISFEGVPVTMPSYSDGGKKSERCVLFPKTCDALLEILVNKKVYVSDEFVEDEMEEEELDDYETLLAKEMVEAQNIELNKMKAKLARLETGDTKFDKE